ncbi:hypothetical protein [Microlunatus kandeliicorticis]|uniref:hypothetical protein n=1 Tax=Microlunatus kandeliicorticis TaxID=1759536 RepID=UPI0015FD2A88|nr:hypothetical protein [Microlunatus kandeliicorticis]
MLSGRSLRHHWETPVVLVVALLARLLPTLRGGGLFGYGNYDDGVYFAGAVGLVHGRLPYRDFLLLHPPGILLALSPFAALTWVISDADALATARVGWMLLGVLNCALVVRLLRRQGRFAAAVGGLAYAVFYPAVYSEHLTLLEAPANTVLLVALLLVPGLGEARAATARVSAARWLAVGAVLAWSPAFKIWGVVPLALVGGWLAISRGRRAAGWYAAGAGLGSVVLLGPFFVAAPTAMARLVVADQLGRSSAHWQLVSRVAALTGVGDVHAGALSTVVAGLAAVGWATLVLVALLDSRGRLFAVLHLGMGALLLATPVWFTHYAGFVAATAALVAGSAARTLAELVRSRLAASAPTRRLLGGAALALVALTAVPLAGVRFGTAFPAATLRPTVAGAPGCVTTDDPVNLVELDVLSRNLTRGCPLVVDLGGYSYDRHPAGPTIARRRNELWQATVRDYLAGGTRVVLSRFDQPSNHPFDPTTRRLVGSWPTAARSGHVVVRTVTVPAA